MNNKVGILRGIFDPVHNGHFSAMIDSVERLKLSKLYVAIKFIGEKDPIASLEQRIDMMRLQVAGYNLPIEIIRQNVQGHLAEIFNLSNKHNSKIINICGSDKISREMRVYGKNGDKFGVVARSEFEIGKEVPKIAQERGIKVTKIIPGFCTSSTNIRKQIINNVNSVEGIDTEVLKYIEENKLYKNRNDVDKENFIDRWHIFLTRLFQYFPKLNLFEIAPPSFKQKQHKSGWNEKFIRTVLKAYPMKGKQLTEFVSIAEKIY